MTNEQMIAWLAIEGWQYRGETLSDNTSVVRGETIIWMDAPNGIPDEDYGMDYGMDYGEGEWLERKITPWEYVRDDHVQAFYRYIQEHNL